MSNERTPSRRRFLAASSTATILGLAGCQSITGTDGTTDGPGTESGTDDGATETTTESASVGVGESFNGEIESGDPTDPTYGRRAEEVSLEVSAGQVVEVTMASAVFEPAFVVLGPEETLYAETSGDRTNVTFVAPSDGTYSIWAASESGSATGEYTLTVRQVTSSADDLRAIGLNESREGVIDDGDPTVPEYNGIGEPVVMTVGEEVPVTISMESDELDTYLIVTTPGGEVLAENDDRSATSYNSRVSQTFAPGSYRIWATTYDGDSTGSYTLTTDALSEEESDLREIEIGETADGFIDGGDEEDPFYSMLAEPVTFSASGGEAVRISMTSSLDTYLILEGPNGDLVVENDDGGEGYDSEVALELPSAGEYTIWATTYSGDATGRYTLSVESVNVDRTDLREIEIGETATGYIDILDENDPYSGKLGEPVTFDGTAEQAIRVSMTSDAVDTYIYLIGPDGDVIASNDDANASTYNSELTTQLPTTGEYTIWATTYDGSATGRYTLTVEEADVDFVDLREIQVGETAEGYIDVGDPTDPELGKLGEPVEFSGESGQTVRVSMTSDELDCYLVLIDPSGAFVAQNDDGGSGYNSEMTHTLADSGTYTIWTVTYSGDATGPYTLSVSDV